MFDPEVSLSAHLEAATEGWVQEFWEYWRLREDSSPDWLDQDEWMQAKSYYVFACLLKEGAETVGNPDQFEALFSDFLSVVREDPDILENDYLGNSLDIVLSDQVYELYAQRARLVDLLRYAVRVDGNIARHYLSRVARCYMFGLAPEGAIMCRAVLEEVLTSNVPEGDVWSSVSTSGARRLQLGHYVQYLKTTPEYSAIHPYALVVKNHGDDAVHVAPGLSTLKESLEALIMVLRRFEPGADYSSGGEKIV